MMTRKKVPEKSGALKRRSKKKSLREQIGLASGQLKITNIFSTSSANVSENFDNGDSSINKNGSFVIENELDTPDDVSQTDVSFQAQEIQDAESVRLSDKDTGRNGSFTVGNSSELYLGTSNIPIPKAQNNIDDSDAQDVWDEESFQSDSNNNETGKNCSFVVGNTSELSLSKSSNFDEAQSVGVDNGTSYAESVSGVNIQSNHTSPLANIDTTDYSANNNSSEKISISSLLKTYDCLVLEKRKVKGVSRPFMTCSTCKEFGQISTKKSRNGVLYMTTGIIVDSQARLNRVITHLEGAPHKHADLAKTNKQLWDIRSDAHKFRKFLNPHNQQLINSLVRMAVDVFNDSLHDTLPAFNWASRSLARERSEQIIEIINEKGFDAPLPTFKPPVSSLRYKNPSGYNEMLEIIADLKMDTTVQKINSSVCYSIQIDGSLDRSNRDNKFVTIRYLESDCSLHCVFLTIVSPKSNGAKGLLEAVQTALGTKLNVDKCVSITTDGESANTGRKAGLWNLLEKELKRKLLTIWCTCHRSDLALEDLQHLVPELKNWKAEVIACASYFRTSKNRTKILNKFAKDMIVSTLAFPAYSEVRFAQHLETLMNAVYRNLPVCRKVWLTIRDSKTSTAREKARAKELIKVWARDTLQFKLTGLMIDTVHIFTNLQKGLQRADILLPDVLTLRDTAVRKFNILISGPMPGGKEEETLQTNKGKNVTIRSLLEPIDNEQHKYNEIREKITMSSKDFTAQRLNIEDDQPIDLMKNILTAKTLPSLITSSVAALKFFLNDNERHKLETLTSEICEQWPILKNVPTIETSDIGCLYSERLRKLFVNSTGSFQFLLGIFIVSSPHSMGTERVVSHYNRIKSPHRHNILEENIVHRLTISLNCSGTAHFDPRPAVVAFMNKKDRRNKPADNELYETHDFVNKFFRKDSKV